MERQLYLERALFVIGQSGVGKNVTLRSMCNALTFWQSEGVFRHKILLSNERNLLISLRPAQEAKQPPEIWADKIKNDMDTDRWCFAGALQAQSVKDGPDAVQYLKSFVNVFQPERTRVFVLSPQFKDLKNGQFLNEDKLIAAVKQIDGGECAFIDSSLVEANGFMLADFFDYT